MLLFYHSPMSLDTFDNWFSSGMNPSEFPLVPDDADSLGNFLADLAGSLAVRSEDHIINAMGILPAVLAEKVPATLVVEAIDTVLTAELEPQKFILLGELGIDFLIIDGSWEACIPRIDSLLQIATQTGDWEELSILYNYRGACLYRLARYPEAKSDLESSLKYAEEINSDRRRGRARINLGLVVQEMGLLEDAAGHYKVALKLARESGDDRTVLSCYLNIGYIYIELKRYDDGKRALEKGIELAEKLGEAIEHIRGRLNLGVLLLDEGVELDKSVGLFEGAIESAEKIDAGVLVAKARSNLSLALFMIGRVDEALEQTRLGLDQAVRDKDHENIWRTHANMARAHKALGEIDQAEEQFKSSLAAFEVLRRSQGTDRSRAEFQMKLRDLQGEFIEFSLEARGPEVAFARLARSKSRALMQASGAEAGEELSDKGLHTGIQAALAEEPGTLLLDYFLHRGKLSIFVCDTNSVTVSDVEASETEIAGLIEAFNEEINLFIASKEYRDAQWSVDTDAPESLVKLSEILLGGVSGRIEGAERLVIVPQGILHALPFNALLDGRNEYIINNCTVNTVYSSDLLLKSTSNDNKRQTRIALLRGDEQGLTGVQSEIKSLRSMFDENLAVVETGRVIQQDGLRGLNTLLKGASAIHFTGHAEFDRDDPYSSALILEDGSRLKASDIASGTLDLGGVDLVTLAGCETGKGDVITGDEVIGIARAFLAAGAGSALVSLWKVSDKATSTLIPEFYRAWKDGEAPSKALQTAVKGMLSEARMHPYFWAPFQIIGKC